VEGERSGRIETQEALREKENTPKRKNSEGGKEGRPTQDNQRKVNVTGRVKKLEKKS